ncbi:MAG: DUF2142 domain-containing protein [Erysipelotrichaceae bacterium]
MIKKLFDKNWEKLIFITLFSLLFAFLVEIFYFNYDLIKLPENNRNLINLDLSKVDNDGIILKDEKIFITKKNEEINLTNESKYINKIVIDYLSENSFKTRMSYVNDNMSGKLEKNSRNSNHSYKLNRFVSNVNNNVKNLKIEFSEKDICITNIRIDNQIHLNSYRILFICSILFTIVSLFIFRKSFFSKIQNTFIFLSLISGFMIILFIPNTTFYSFDDETHFKYAYSLLDFGSTSWSTSSQQMLSATPFPFDCINSFEDYQMQDKYLNDNHKDIISTTNSGKFISYNKVAYIPSAVFVKVAKIIGLPFTVMFKFGKLANLLFYSFMIYFAIKITSKGKLFFAFLGLLPTNLWLASNYSLDPIIFGCLALGVALFIKEIMEKDKVLSFNNMVVFILIMIFGILPKAIYAPLILLPLLFSSNKFNDKKQEKNFKFGIILIFLVLISSFVLPAILSPSQTGDFRVQGTSQVGQLSNILNNPVGYISIFFNNAGVQFLDKLFGAQTLGNFAYLGEVNCYLNFISMLCLLILSFVEFSGNNYKLDNKKRISIFILTCIIIGLIWTSLYIDYNPVGSLVINGVQGRYFVPLLLLLPLICGIKNYQFKSDVINTVFMLLAFIVIMGAIYLSILSVTCV